MKALRTIISETRNSGMNFVCLYSILLSEKENFSTLPGKHVTPAQHSMRKKLPAKEEIMTGITRKAPHLLVIIFVYNERTPYCMGIGRGPQST